MARVSGRVLRLARWYTCAADICAWSLFPRGSPKHARHVAPRGGVKEQPRSQKGLADLNRKSPREIGSSSKPGNDPNVLAHASSPIGHLGREGPRVHDYSTQDL
eukprot:2921891-Pyramimonas_sp.AAC.1